MLTNSLPLFATACGFSKFFLRFGVLAGCAVMVAQAQAQNASITLDLNDDAVRLSGQQMVPARQMSWGGSVFNHQDRGTVVTGDFHISGNAATKARPITAGLGGRVVYAKLDDDFFPDPVIVNDPVGVLIDDGGLGGTDLAGVLDPTSDAPGSGAGLGVPSQDGYGLAVGGFFKGQIPNYDRFGYGGHLYYSPDVLAFGDMDEYLDATLYGSYGVLRNGDVYVGIRALKADFKDAGDFNFDTGLHVGFTLKF